MNQESKLAATAALIFIVAVSAFYIGTQTNIIPPAQNDDVLFQIAAFNTFSAGKYTGFITYEDLERHGDFGIGTFDGLDGEMVALDGIFYQIPSTGVPKEADPTQTAPYATISYFHPTQTFEVSDINYAELQTFLDSKFSDEAIYAIKVHGSYRSIEVRSPLKQSEPYPNITDALKGQALFNLTNTSATAVGFFFPISMDGIDYPGYHLHVVTNDFTAGGHILDFQIQQATIEVDEIKQYNLILP